jgi:hypothetical protein
VTPLTCGTSLCSNNCPTHKGWVYLFSHTCKTKTKRIFKMINPKKNIEKTKRKPTIMKRDKKRFSKITKKTLK